MDETTAQLAVNFGVPLSLLLLGFVTGTVAEKSHYRRIRLREQRSRRMPTMTFRDPPEHWQIEDARMVTGNVVISLDYFKRFLAGLRALVGGRVKSYESLLDRARREAILRMKEQAFDAGFNAVLNVRLETSRMASARRDGKGTAGIEILAFGTAIKRRV